MKTGHIEAIVEYDSERLNEKLLSVLQAQTEGATSTVAILYMVDLPCMELYWHTRLDNPPVRGRPRYS